MTHTNTNGTIMICKTNLFYFSTISRKTNTNTTKTKVTHHIPDTNKQLHHSIYTTPTHIHVAYTNTNTNLSLSLLFQERLKEYTTQHIIIWYHIYNPTNIHACSIHTHKHHSSREVFVLLLKKDTVISLQNSTRFHANRNF